MGGGGGSLEHREARSVIFTEYLKKWVRAWEFFYKEFPIMNRSPYKNSYYLLFSALKTKNLPIVEDGLILVAFEKA